MRSPVLLRILFMLFVLCSVLPARAQDVCMKHFSVNNGLPSSECHAVMQDSKGYIWIATDAGVVKYDGYRFHSYNGNNGLPDNTVFKIHEDRKGKIWFVSYSGEMSWYSHETDSIYTPTANSFLIRHAKSAPVDFCFDEHDTLWVSYYRCGYVKIIPPAYNTCKVYESATACYFIREVSKGRFVYGSDLTHDKRAKPLPLEVTPAGKSVGVNVQLLHQQLSHTALTEVRNGVQYFTNGSEVYRLRGLTAEAVVAEPEKANDNINSIYLDRQNGLWVCTWDKGLLYYSASAESLNPRCFLPGENVSAVYEDRDQGIWICTIRNGIYFIPSLKISQAGTVKTDDIYSYNSSVVYLANDYNLVQFAPGDSVPLHLNEKHYWSNYISNGLALLGASPSVIYNLRSKTEVPVYCRVENGEKKFLRIKQMLDADTGHFFGVDNYSNALYRINKRTGESVQLAGFLPTVYSMALYNDGIYLGTKSGLYCYLHNRLLKPDGFSPGSDAKIEAMTVWKDMLLLASKGNGIIGMRNDKQVLHLTEANGLLSNICRSVATDSEGNIWAGTNKGITCFCYTGGSYRETRSLTVNDGLSSNEVNHILVTGNMLYAATNNGVNYFRRDDILKPVSPIQVNIEKMVLNNSPVVNLDGRELEHNENFLQIYFRGLIPRREGNVTYRYRLLGFDTAWVVSQNTFVQYTALPPGDYQFMLTALSDGIASSGEPVIRFRIRAPFWQSGWFIALCILAGIILVLFIYRMVVAMIRRKEEAKMRVQKTIVESELKALRAQMNPHFIFNAINSIQHFVLKNESLNAHKYLVKLSKLIRAVLENSKHETVPLTRELETLELYMELEALRASFGFDYEFHVDESLAGRTVLIPTMLLQPFVENAILHGLLALSGRRGLLRVSIHEEAGTLICTIDDNGIGRAAAEEIRIKKNTGHVSMGMHVTSERIEYLNKFAAFFITAEITDKTDGGIPAGTLVTLKIKTV
jgi:streptogramin lyase